MLATIIKNFCLSRWLKHRIKTDEQLKRHQNKLWLSLNKEVLTKSPFYKEYVGKALTAFPIINKAVMMENFDRINTRSLTKEQVLSIAEKAENSRDFSPTIDDVAVGLSSGTSGKKGIFTVSQKERAFWVGDLLAKALTKSILKKQVIAFFLRANNQLYESLSQSRKIQINYFDLLDSFDHHISKLNKIQPTIISAPATVLLHIAQAIKSGDCHIKPHTIFSVAEVLEPIHQQFIEKAVNLPVRKIYQCTEGFLGITNSNGYLQLNEENLIIEKEWLDESRFVPIITDLRRQTQPIIRYRLDDVLMINHNKDNPFTEVAYIEGREGDICYGINQENKPQFIFSDLIRQHIIKCPIVIEDYQLNQIDQGIFEIAITPILNDKDKLTFETHMNALFKKLNCFSPSWQWLENVKEKYFNKKRRIQCLISKQDLE